MLIKYIKLLRRWFIPNIEYTFLKLKTKQRVIYFFNPHTVLRILLTRYMKLCTHTHYDNLDTHKSVRVNSTKKISCGSDTLILNKFLCGL